MLKCGDKEWIPTKPGCKNCDRIFKLLLKVIHIISLASYTCYSCCLKGCWCLILTLSALQTCLTHSDVLHLLGAFGTCDSFSAAGDGPTWKSERMLWTGHMDNLKITLTKHKWCLSIRLHWISPLGYHTLPKNMYCNHKDPDTQDCLKI